MTVTQRLDQHDKQIAAIRDLVKEGIKMVVETRRLALETRKDLRKLAAMQLATAEAQKRTDESLQALIGSLRGGGNGHTKRPVE
jgi:regulator of replication initiation timing